MPKCKICHGEFDDLDFHFNVVHKNELKFRMKTLHAGMKDHKCGTCGKTFGKLFNLKRHIESVHEGIRDHKCQLCGTAFHQKTDLKIHIKNVHERKRDYKCGSCGVDFVELRSLNNHIIKTHTEHSVNQFCDKKSLKNIIQNIHEEQNYELNQSLVNIKTEEIEPKEDNNEHFVHEGQNYEFNENLVNIKSEEIDPEEENYLPSYGTFDEESDYYDNELVENSYVPSAFVKVEIQEDFDEEIQG